MSWVSLVKRQGCTRGATAEQGRPSTLLGGMGRVTIAKSLCWRQWPLGQDNNWIPLDQGSSNWTYKFL